MNGPIRVRRDVLIVPPMECAWLSSPEQKIPGRGRVSFEVAGETDATVILKDKPGSRRWQHSRGATEQGYTVIIGSHANTKLKIERNGSCVAAAVCAWATIRSDEFREFWIQVDAEGEIAVGARNVGCVFLWVDPEPLEGITSIGLSSWDRHLRYRNIRVDLELQHPSTALSTASVPTPSLYTSCVQSLLGDDSLATAQRLLEVTSNATLPAAELLKEHAVRCLAERFDAVAEDREWLGRQPAAALLALLESRALCANERGIFDAVSAWSFYGAEEHTVDSPIRPEGELQQLLPTVKFPMMDDVDLKAVRALPLTNRYPPLLDLLDEAVASREVRNGSMELPEPPTSISVMHRREVTLSHVPGTTLGRHQPRASPLCKQLNYFFSGDKLGVCHYLGTSCGRSEYVNPMVINRVRVLASSPESRTTNVKGVAGNRFSKTSFAAPRSENGHLTSWWMMDLLEHKLKCNYYTIRHDGSTDFMREWVLQGSEDGHVWLNLRQHVNDLTFHSPGQFGSWPVTTDTSYQMFRLLLTGPTTSTTAPMNMCLSNMELYGSIMGPGVC